MRIAEREIALKDGRKIVLRSPEISEAGEVLAHLYHCSEETHFLTRCPEERDITEESEVRFVQGINADSMNFMLAAFSEGCLVATATIESVGKVRKLRHRAELGISIRKELWNLGLGTVMLQELLSQAEKNGFEQVELGVFSDNQSAIHLYEKIGFRRTGVIPHAFRLKAGEYCDEVQMVYEFSKD